MLNFTGIKESNEFVLVDKGEYEVIVNLSWKKPISGGDPYINCAFKIRKDVDQKFGGRIIWDSIYKDKKTGDFQKNKINGLLSTIKEEERKKSFNDYDELIQYLNDKPMRVVIDLANKDFNDPNSEKKNIVKYMSYLPTNFPEVKNIDEQEIETKLPEGFSLSDLPF
nr:MAG TPA: Protein of unknown function (DUF669) [Caudoviricetes sp.]